MDGKPSSWGRWAKNILRVGLLAVVVEICVVVACLVMLAASFAIPNGRIINKTIADVAHGMPVAAYQPNGLGDRTDNYTEELGTTIGVLPVHSQVSLWRRVAMVPRGHGGPQAITSFREMRSHPDADYAGQSAYVRYWAGFSVLTRPALAWDGVYGARVVSMGFLVGAALWLAWALGRRAGPWTAAAFVGTYVCSSDLTTLTTQFTHAVAQGVILGCAAAVLTFAHTWRGVLSLSVVAGGTFAFVDLLTNPPAAMLATVCAAGFAGWARTKRVRATAGWLVAAALGWGFGFVVTWAARWPIAASVVGWRYARDNVVETAKFRLDGTTSSAGQAMNVSTAFGESTRLNIDVWLGYPLGQVFLVVVVGLFIVALVTALIGGRRSVALFGILLVPVLIVPGYLEVMKSHSQIHTFFVFRDIAMAAAAVAAVSTNVLERRGLPWRRVD